jgi:hypothetical protein
MLESSFRLHPLMAELANQPVQSRRRVRDPAIVPNLAPQATLRYRHDDPREYRVMRMSDMPLMDVTVISTDSRPTGIGEAGVPVVAPAIANAVAPLTGKRLRHLPVTPDRVKRALA